jgi:hypothetical protein
LPGEIEEKYARPKLREPVFGPRNEPGMFRILNRNVNHSTATFGESVLEKEMLVEGLTNTHFIYAVDL